MPDPISSPRACPGVQGRVAAISVSHVMPWMPGRARHDGRAVLAVLLALFCAFLIALPAAAQTFPKFTGLVVDDAGILPPEVKADLTRKLEALQKDTKRQLVVATIGDTQGYPLEEYGYKLGRAWGVGLNDVNNGAILFVAPNNPAGQRGPRIEVGRGLEPILTDALSSVIIPQEMMPKLRDGDVPGALSAGTDALVRQLRASPEEAQARLDAATKAFDKQHQRGRSGEGGNIVFAVVILVFVLAFVGLAVARRGGGGRRYRGDGDSGLGHVVMWTIANEIASAALRGGGGRSSGWGGGGGWGGGSSGGSDGSWGGGGFTGGGGGDFGGGGASGDW